jgi:hypothetical protein
VGATLWETLVGAAAGAVGCGSGVCPRQADRKKRSRKERKRGKERKFAPLFLLTCEFIRRLGATNLLKQVMAWLKPASSRLGSVAAELILWRIA